MHDFDATKAKNIIVFFAQKAGGIIEKTKLLKLIWLSDRAHLRHYGVPILNDCYFAFPDGPVPVYVQKIVTSDPTYINRIAVSMNDRCLSVGNIHFLNKVYDHFGNWSTSDLVAYSKTFPEWSRQEQRLAEKTCAPMDYPSFFDNPYNGGDCFFKKDDELLDYNKAYFLDSYKKVVLLSYFSTKCA